MRALNPKIPKEKKNMRKLCLLFFLTESNPV